MWIIPFAAIALGVIALDQASKLLILNFLYEDQLELIPGILRFTYVENRGMAFGLLADHRWVFMVISTAAIVGLLLYVGIAKPKSRFEILSLAFIIGGGIGNMIDRIWLGYVIDFIDFCAFPKLWMWIFNVADACVCIGAGMLVLWMVLDIIRDEKAKKAALAGAAETPDENGEKDA